jgi:hypothetical protein
MRKTIIAAMVAASLSACSTTFEAPPGASDTQIQAQSAKCRLFARQGERGFVAFGSQSYVAGAALGNAIGNAVRAAADYKDCMIASGFREVRKDDNKG